MKKKGSKHQVEKGDTLDIDTIDDKQLNPKSEERKVNKRKEKKDKELKLKLKQREEEIQFEKDLLLEFEKEM